MTDGRHIFVDTNILVYATIAAAPLHQEARTVLDKLWDEGAHLYISHQVVREYIVNTTRPQMYNPALSQSLVLEQVEDFRKSFHILPDSAQVLEKFLELVGKVTVGGKQIHDTNIAAVMLANDLTELLTHNVKDFERYSTYIQLIALMPERF